MDEEPCKKKLRLSVKIDADTNTTTKKEETECVIDIALDEKENVIDNVSDKKEDDEKTKHEMEIAVGVTCFINNSMKSYGIIKQRFSDFMVRECDLNGEPVYLTNMDHCDHDLKDTSENLSAVDCPLSQETSEKIKKFSENEDKTKTLTLDVDNDKEHRKIVHKYIKDTFKSIETGTVSLEDNSRAIILSFKSNNTNGSKRRFQPTKKVPKYCHFVLFKQNKDTIDCVNLLAKMLHTKSQLFSYAGTKDRRATTIQRLCVQNMLSKRVQGVNSRLKNIVLGNFSYSQQGLSLGDLSGNEFTIVIRNVLSEDNVTKACLSLREKGFINYFGLQRFGTGAVPTHIIGKALLTEQYEEAVNMILTHRQNEDNPQFGEHAAKKIWTETKDLESAKKAVKSNYSIEGKILESLSNQNQKNFLGAIQRIPRNMRLLYLHSYQSLVWNKVVSRRIMDNGFQVCVGDLVLNKEKDTRGFEDVLMLTENNIMSKNYNIFDIVLPLPGYDMKYPGNNMEEYYKMLLQQDGLDLNNMRRKQKDFSLSGSYRNIVVKPKNVKWEIINYSDFKISLIQNDYEKLTNTSPVVENKESGKFKALKLQMTLPPSSYATSALREVIDHEASYKTQVKLNETVDKKQTLV